jgi:hypothetical protein
MHRLPNKIGNSQHLAFNHLGISFEPEQKNGETAASTPEYFC